LTVFEDLLLSSKENLKNTSKLLFCLYNRDEYEAWHVPEALLREGTAQRTAQVSGMQTVHRMGKNLLISPYTP